MSKQSKKPGRVKAAILGWLGVPVGLTDEAFWASLGKTEAGQQVNERTVMQLSAVWACARLIAETIATLPLGIYERQATGRRAASEHPIDYLLSRQPNSRTTAAVFWEAMVVAMLLQGNGFAERMMLGGRLVALQFLVPARLTISRDSAGKRRYRYTDSDGTQREIPEENIFRIPGFTMDGDWGLSVVQYGAKVFGSALAATHAANSTFEKGLSPTVAFKMGAVLKKEQREEFRENIRSISGAIHAGEAPLLEGGMEAQTIGINPKDAQLLESRSFSVEEICRWFRVPPFMVGHSEKSTSWGTGIEQQMIAFLTFTLRPWLSRIEQAINKDLLGPVQSLRYYAEFSIEGLLRADSAGRADYYDKMTRGGQMTRDEVRVKENLPTMGGNAGVLTVDANLIPLDLLGKTKGTDNA